jgi:hypothetical protein
VKHYLPYLTTDAFNEELRLMTAMDAEKSSVDEYRPVLFLKDLKSFSINFLD